MTKSEIHKIATKKREWDRNMRGFDRFWNGFKKGIRNEMEGMMYGKRPKDAVDRFEHAFFWWVKLFIILFALKGVNII
jgi:hypothetical protein